METLLINLSFFKSSTKTVSRALKNGELVSSLYLCFREARMSCCSMVHFPLPALVLRAQSEDDNVLLAMFQGKEEGGIRDVFCVLGGSLCFIHWGLKCWLRYATLE